MRQHQDTWTRYWTDHILVCNAGSFLTRSSRTPFDKTNNSKALWKTAVRYLIRHISAKLPCESAQSQYIAAVLLGDQTAYYFLVLKVLSTYSSPDFQQLTLQIRFKSHSRFQFCFRLLAYHAAANWQILWYCQWLQAFFTKVQYLSGLNIKVILLVNAHTFLGSKSPGMRPSRLE